MEYIENVHRKCNFNFEIKDEQKECLQYLLEGYNVMAILPTGFGKSLFYTLFPLLLTEMKNETQTCLVVSPLKALIKDQVAELQSRNINAVALMKDAPMESFRAINDKTAQLIFTPPEFLHGHMIDMLRPLQSQVCLVVFDECHCISEWGLDFRPEYRKVARIVSLFNKCPTLLMTATATVKIQEDLYEILSLTEDTKVVALQPDRPNVYIHIETNVTENIEERLEWLVKVILNNKEKTPKTIIYCRNMHNCKSMYIWLMDELGENAYVQGVEKFTERLVDMYHSRTDTNESDHILTEFRKPESKLRVVCATVAFGMGINIPDIRCIINWGIPSSTLTFWQEIGRCGRNGEASFSITYPYPRSIFLCPEEDLKRIVKGNTCYRENILKLFKVKGMRYNSPKQDGCESKQCKICRCGLCVCCSVCHAKCKCPGKLQDRINDFFNQQD